MQSSVMVNRGISPAIPRGAADFVIGLEPVETARALPYISDQSVVFMNRTPIVPFSLSQDFVRERGSGQYPDVKMLEASIRSVTPHLLTLDGSDLAVRAGSAKTLNIVMLGCLFGSRSFPYSPDEFMNTVVTTAPARLVDTNMRAFQQGVQLGRLAQLVGEKS